MNKPTFKLSVLDLVPAINQADAAFALEQAVKLAQTAEKYGFYRYWAAEHHDMSNLACSAPEILLAHIGARTERIRLGSGALLLPHYKPLKVAETFHMLASLYPGRIDLGIGRAPGGSAHVSMALSGNFLENVRKLPEALEDVSALVQGNYSYDGVPVQARPAPPVPPELWLLGTNTKSAAYAAELGMGYVFGQFMSDTSGEDVLRAYRKGFVPSPLLTVPKSIVAIGVVCAETEGEAHTLASRMENQKLLIGTPQTISAQLTDMSHLYGVDEFIIVTMIPDYELRLHSYELLGEVMKY
jgi:luciferase family oxidoreductase group 1